MCSMEAGRKSDLSVHTDDSDWSDIDTDTEEQTESKKLKIDLKEDDERQEPSEVKVCTSEPKASTSGKVGRKSSASNYFSRKKKANSAKKKKKPACNRKPSITFEVPMEVMSPTEADSFHVRVEAAAKQLKLNRTQVKSVIRTLVESPDLYNLILEKAGDKPEADSKVEPRITRKIAKEVVETGGKLNWFLDKVSKTPKKVTDESAALLNVDFPDDESDQEYDPLKDPEALEALSDDDSVVTGTPNSSIATNDVTMTPVSEGPFQNTDEKMVLTGRAELETFKRPLEAAKVVRSLNFDHLLTSDVGDASKAGHPSMSPRLTRSRASLKQVTIEELESKFVPCDITPDMYDTDVDDYTLFLAETFGQPVATVDDAEAEADPDPDFVYQESEELLDVQDEFVHNRSTKISQKEVDQLMQELFEAYELDQEEKTAKKGKKKDQMGEMFLDRGYDDHNTHYLQPEMSLTKDQTDLLAQQMRQHVQLLTQTALLSSNTQKLETTHHESKEMLSQLVSNSFLKPYSMFAPDNLFPSLKLINEWEQMGCQPVEPKRGTKKGGREDLSNELMEYMSESPAFIYPNLLPTCGFYTEETNKSVIWSNNEDHLLAIGLERFLSEEAPTKKGHHTLAAAKFISSHGIVKNKTPKQIHTRLKNKRSTQRKSTSCDAIDYFLTNKVAPSIAQGELIPYNASSVVCPKYSDPSLLPNRWKQFLKISDDDKKCKTIPESTITSFSSSQQLSQPRQFFSPETEPWNPLVTSTDLPGSEYISSTPTKSGIGNAPWSTQIPTTPTGTYTTWESTSQCQLASMPTFEQTPEKLKSSEKLRPLAIRPGSLPLKFGKSPLSKERERLLKKYSPMKKKKTGLKSKKIKEKLEQSRGGHFQSSLADIKEQTVENISEEFESLVPTTINQDPMRCTILETAVQECGITDSMFENEIEGQDENCFDDDAEAEARDNIEVNHDQMGDPDQGDFEVTDPSCPTSQHQASKRRTRLQREAEITLMLMEKETPSELAQRKQQEAFDLVVAAKELLEPEKLNEFIQKVIQFKKDPVRAFMELHPICAGHTDLQEMLMDLISPEEALTLGSKLYWQYELRSNMKVFFRKLKTLYANQPLIRTRILKEISSLVKDVKVTMSDLKGFAAKHFRSNQHLHDVFLAIFPKMRFPDSLLPDDPEHIDLSEEEDDDEDLTMDGIERLEIPASQDEPNYGGDNCPCPCHLMPISPHCVHCSIKFINGKVYIREGKSLRQVTIHYPTSSEKVSSKPEPFKVDDFARGDDILDIGPLSFGAFNK